MSARQDARMKESQADGIKKEADKKLESARQDARMKESQADGIKKEADKKLESARQDARMKESQADGIKKEADKKLESARQDARMKESQADGIKKEADKKLESARQDARMKGGKTTKGTKEMMTPNVHQRELAKTLKTQEALKSSSGNQVAKSEQVTGEVSDYSPLVKTPSRLPVRQGKELAVNDKGRLIIQEQDQHQHQKLLKPKNEVVELKQEGGVQPFNNLKTIDETVPPDTKSSIKTEPTAEIAELKKLKFEVISPEIVVGAAVTKIEKKGGANTKHKSSVMERKIPIVVPKAVEFKKTGLKKVGQQ